MALTLTLLSQSGLSDCYAKTGNQFIENGPLIWKDTGYFVDICSARKLTQPSQGFDQ